jgi:DNA-binding SARP family transcriptional activator
MSGLGEAGAHVLHQVRMYRIELFGGLSLRGPHGHTNEYLLQRRPLAVLAVLALARARGCSRSKLTGMLWPEDDEASSRHHLSDALCAVRRVLGPTVVQVRGEMLYADPAQLTSDVAAFEDALAQGRVEDAAAAYQGPLLDGFYVPGAGDFDECIGRERDRLAGQYAAALERAAHAAATAGHHRSAAEWLHRLVAHDPFATRVVLKLMAALEAAGDRANALRVAEVHERRLREELDVAPDAALVQGLRRLRALPPAALDTLALRETPPPADPVPAERTTRVAMAPPSAPAVRRRPAARRVRQAAARAAVVVVVASSLVAGTAPALDPDRWVVPPFTVVGDDSLLRRLALEAPGLIAMRLAGPPGPHVHDRANVARRWLRARADPQSGVSDEEQMAIARAVGGGRVVDGMLARDGGQVEVVIRLLTVPRGDHIGVQAGHASPESLRVMLGQLIDTLRAQDLQGRRSVP